MISVSQPGASARTLMIAAPRSGSGKTTLTLGLLRALHQRGLRVSGAKCGPDYIDPAFHAAATGRTSLNLDSWSMPPNMLGLLARQAANGCDLVICEASMGLFDGVPAPLGRTGASADIAAALGAPVLLVLDISGQAQSAAAIVKGCMDYDPRVTIAGVVLNRVASARHQRLVQGAIEALGVPVLGCLPRCPDMVLPERHLGLVQAGETLGLDARLDAMAAFVCAHVDLDAIAALALPITGASGPAATLLRPPGQHIAIARDDAFSFIYPHLVEGWRGQGAQISWFSPLQDQPPPQNCDICWLPGGYPELHASALAGASGFLAGLRSFAQTRPVHGECGGYMVLGESLIAADGTPHRMAGLLSVVTSFAQRKMTLGYRHIRLASAGCLGPTGAQLRGHEFHYASIASLGTDAPFAFASDAYGSAPEPSGCRRGFVTGSFFHVIAVAQPTDHAF